MIPPAAPPARWNPPILRQPKLQHPLQGHSRDWWDLLLSRPKQLNRPKRRNCRLQNKKWWTQFSLDFHPP